MQFENLVKSNQYLSKNKRPVGDSGRGVGAASGVTQPTFGRFAGPALRRGFTIVELLIVIVVIGILATISVASYTGIQERARQTAHKAMIAQAESGIAAHAIMHGEDYEGVRGKLVGYLSQAGEIELIRPIDGKPDLTMYVACSGITSIDSHFEAPASLRPPSNTRNLRFQSGAPGQGAMGIRVDTSATTNGVDYVDNVRQVGGSYISWLQVSNGGSTVTFNYNQASAHTTMSLPAHTGWNFTQLMAAGSNNTCTEIGALVFEAAHSDSARAAAIGWLSEQYGIDAGGGT